MYYVYILQSIKDRKHYIGSTKDLKNRLKEHNSGKTISLKHRRPLKVIYYEEYNSNTEARRRERQIKNYKGGSAFKKLIMGP